jgi:hypothetical protein
VSRDIAGAAELDAYGDWQPTSDYGAIWFPRNTQPGWVPYHYGHWVNHAPWGWIWVEDEPWGYAPFHYGRWVSFGGRWGWVPGPPAAHPIWAPALVVFAGGISFGGAGGSVWFPLGPGEAYRPWYPCSPTYVNQVNITNITETRVIHVQTTYVNVVNVTNVTYVNRTIAVTAVSHEDFAAGHSAAKSAVHIDVHQLDHVKALARPEPTPTAASFTGRPPARAVPVKSERPALINAQGKLVSARPGAKPVDPPVKPVPVAKPLPGHRVVAPPPGVKPQPVKTPAPPEKLEGKPIVGTPEKPPAKPFADTGEKPEPKEGKSGDSAGTKPGDKDKTADKDKAADKTAPKPGDKAKPGDKTPPKPGDKDKPKKSDKDKKDDTDKKPE